MSLSVQIHEPSRNSLKRTFPGVSGAEGYYSKGHFSLEEQSYHNRLDDIITTGAGNSDCEGHFPWEDRFLPDCQDDKIIDAATIKERNESSKCNWTEHYYSKKHFSQDDQNSHNQLEGKVKTDKHQSVSQTTVQNSPQLSSKYKSKVKPSQNQQSGLLSDRYLRNRSHKDYVRD